MVQIVGIHEFIKHIRAEYNGLGNGDPGIFEFLEFGVVLHHIVYERQTAPFASQRTFTDAAKLE